VNRLGEDELVAGIRRLLAGDAPGVHLGPGDDAALVELGSGWGVLTTDMLVEDVHFRRDRVSARDLGYRAVAVNVSDVAAMGGSPRYALVALGLPTQTDPGWVVELYGGMRDCAAEHAVAVVGGDTSRSDRIVLAVTVLGEVQAGAAVLRSGARVGDRIVVSGSLGAAAGGLALLEADPLQVAEAAATEWGHALLAALLRPAARVGEGQTLAQVGATAMMDLSDGLSTDLARLCRESGVRGAVRLADVPVSPDVEKLQGVLPVDPLEMALSGGEDYELVATLPAAAVERARGSLADRFGTALTEIGEIRPGDGVVAIERDGSERPLEPRGWDHFA
jgi:thiamine-monophosphate kinase